MNKKIGNHSFLVIAILIFSIIYLSVSILNIRSNERIENSKIKLKYREYIAQRINTCYQIENQEKDIWTNFDSGYYDLEEDVCWMKYNTEDETNPTWRAY